MSDMILKVEAAIAEAALEKGAPEFLAKLGVFLADHPGLIGRAAVEAMRQPTAVMLEPGAVSRNEKRLDGTYPVNYLVVALDIWPQMIDAALK